MKNKCEVSGFTKCTNCGARSYDTCNTIAVTRIRDVVCDHVSKSPFWVCAKHKKQFLKFDKGEKPHYKEVKQNGKKNKSNKKN